jgi:hypothetical protein
MSIRSVLINEEMYALEAGHVMHVLKQIPNETVQLIVTSPPYYGLRKYDTENPPVWPPFFDIPYQSKPENCAHQWGDSLPRPGHSYRNDQGEMFGDRGDFSTISGINKASGGKFCRKCGSWKGDLGLEPCADMYVRNITLVCRELRRVLRSVG